MLKKMKDQMMRKLEDQASCSCSDTSLDNTSACCQTDCCSDVDCCPDTETTHVEEQEKTGGCCGSSCC